MITCSRDPDLVLKRCRAHLGTIALIVRTIDLYMLCDDTGRMQRGARLLMYFTDLLHEELAQNVLTLLECAEIRRELGQLSAHLASELALVTT